ncbi:MAG: FkbM family methyltransferase [Gemmataceae bacterium]
MGLLRELYRRYLIARHRPPHWQLRTGTIDRRIFRTVVVDNEYRLPDRFDAADVLLDIGAHTGSFALAALRRGAGTVVCCEPDRDNFALLEDNLRPWTDRLRLRRAAVWRSDEPVASLCLHNPLDERNTGANQVTADATAASVPVAAFDALVDELTADGRRLRLVKLDCEGAEWPILLTARRLDRVDALCGEYHLGSLPPLFDVAGHTPYSPALLAHHLEAQGFAVTVEPLSRGVTPVGLFFAQRR